MSASASGVLYNLRMNILSAFLSKQFLASWMISYISHLIVYDHARFNRRGDTQHCQDALMHSQHDLNGTIWKSTYNMAKAEQKPSCLHSYNGRFPAVDSKVRSLSSPANQFYFWWLEWGQLTGLGNLWQSIFWDSAAPVHNFSKKKTKGRYVHIPCVLNSQNMCFGEQSSTFFSILFFREIQTNYISYQLFFSLLKN